MRSEPLAHAEAKKSAWSLAVSGGGGVFARCSPKRANRVDGADSAGQGWYGVFVRTPRLITSFSTLIGVREGLGQGEAQELLTVGMSNPVNGVASLEGEGHTHVDVG